MISNEDRDELRGRAVEAWRHQTASDASDATTRVSGIVECGLQRLALSPVRFRAFDRPTAVVADGRVIERVLLAHALRDDGRLHLAADAEDGAEALATVIIEQPDVVVLQRELTRIDAIDLAARLRVYAPRTRTILLDDPATPPLELRPSTVDVVVTRNGDR